MSEQITHLAVADDSRRLALASPRIGEAVKAALRDHQDTMRLGAITRASEAFAGPMVLALCARQERPGRRDGEKLAFCLGTMAHRAADRMMKPVLRAQSADGACRPIDISVYHDVFLFDRLYGRGAKHPYAPGALGPTVAPPAPGLDARAAEEYFRVLLQRALLAAHTLKPDLARPEAWVEALLDRLQEMRIDLGLYHRALAKPDPELVRRAITDANFYNEGDAILALLADLRAGRDVPPEEFLKRCYLGDKDSLYARAVSMAYGYIHVASDYWEGRAGEALFLDAIKR